MSSPVRIADLPEDDESPLGRAGRLIRSARVEPARPLASRHLVRWRIRASMYGRRSIARRVLRPALVALLLFASGAVLGVTLERLVIYLRTPSPGTGRASLVSPATSSPGSPAEVPRRPIRVPVAASPPPAETPTAPAPRRRRASPARALAQVEHRPSARPDPTAERPASSRIAPPAFELGTRGAAPAAVPPPEVVPEPARTPPVAPRPDEQALFASALHKLRGAGDAAGALAVLDQLTSRFPDGIFAPEATALRAEALARLRRPAEALAALDAEPQPRSAADRVVRGELLSSLRRWHAAIAQFDSVLARGMLATHDDAAVIERALWGRASARVQIGDRAGARADLEDYLRRFPQGRFAQAAARSLGQRP